MITMTVAVTVIRRHGFIGHFHGLFPELAVSIIILHIIVTKVEVCNNIGVDHGDDAVPAFDQGIMILSV